VPLSCSTAECENNQPQSEEYYRSFLLLPPDLPDEKNMVKIRPLPDAVKRNMDNNQPQACF
jgi:hypothetical protein